jgi:hypothetical protein
MTFLLDYGAAALHIVHSHVAFRPSMLNASSSAAGPTPES